MISKMLPRILLLAVMLSGSQAHGEDSRQHPPQVDAMKAEGARIADLK
jgi:hypothetical protein